MQRHLNEVSKNRRGDILPGSGPDRRQGRPADRLNQRFAISKAGMEAD